MSYSEFLYRVDDIACVKHNILHDEYLERKELIKVLAEFWPDIPFIKFETVFEYDEVYDTRGNLFNGVSLERVHYVLKAEGRVTETD